MSQQVSPNFEQNQEYRQPHNLEQQLWGCCPPQVASTTSDHVKRQPMCQVCGADTNSLHLNYGVSTCLSCRAFFRRSVQNGRGFTLQCTIQGGMCQVTKETRRRCESCRYLKCLQAGMQVHSVLDDRQKTQRFRVMIRKQKKMAKASNDPSLCAAVAKNILFFWNRMRLRDKRSSESKKKRPTGNTEPSSELASISQSVNLSSCVDVAETDKNLQENILRSINVAGGTENCLSSVYCNCKAACLGEIRSQERTVDLREKKPTEERLQRIRHTWEEAWRLNLDLNSQFSQDLLRSHLGRFSLTKSHWQTHLKSLEGVFTDFALQQPEFTDLPLRDMLQLLGRNVGTFLQFVLGMYFSAKDAKDQISWMLLNRNWKTEKGQGSFLHFMSLFVLNKELSLCKGDCREYLGQLDKLSLLCPSFSFDETPFFALSCLFSTAKCSWLEKKEDIDAQLQNLQALIEFKREMQGAVFSNGVLNALAAVESIDNHFEEMVDWKSECDPY